MFDLNWNEYLTWLPSFWDGFKLSLEVTFFSLVIGFPAGFILSLGEESKSRIYRGLAIFIVEAGRGAPVLVVLEFVYFGFPSVHLPLSALVSSIVAFSWNTAAYSTDIIRAGLAAVPVGQKEAANALNLSYVDSYRFIIVPQGLRVAIPAMMALAILIFQGTSLCYAISLPEIVSRAYTIGSRTFQYFAALTIAGLFFAAVCIPASLVVARLEKKASAGDMHRR